MVDENVKASRALFWAQQQSRIAQKRAAEKAAGWRDVGRVVTPEELAELPVSTKANNRSGDVWVQYFHNLCQAYVIAPGRYLFRDGCWTAQFLPQEAGGSMRRVDAVAWAPIEADLTPWAEHVVPWSIRDEGGSRVGSSRHALDGSSADSERS